MLFNIPELFTRSGTEFAIINTKGCISRLTEVIADLIEAEPGRIIPVGGPSDYTWNEIAALCFQIIGGRCSIRHWSEWLLRAALSITRVVSQPTYGTLSFLGT